MVPNQTFAVVILTIIFVVLLFMAFTAGKATMRYEIKTYGCDLALKAYEVPR